MKSNMGYMASPLSRLNIRLLARAVRKKLRIQDVLYVDIVGIAENVFPELFKDEGYEFNVVSAEEMSELHGLTDTQNAKIYIREDVYDNACKGKGRDRMTIAHEVGHFLMHDGITLGGGDSII